MRILRAGDHKAMPWKNGGGVTREVAMAPDPRGHAPFLWRLSLATIRESGPFSTFPGIDRSIAALRGDPVRLMIDGSETVRLEALGRPFAFAGEDKVKGIAEGAETTDLNIMTLRGRARHEMKRVQWTGELGVSTDYRLTMLVFVGPIRALSDNGEYHLDTDDALVEIAPGENLNLVSPALATAYHIGIDW